MPDARRIMRGISNDASPIRFPVDQARRLASRRGLRGFFGDNLPRSADELQHAINDLTGRIGDLARELNCLGYFDDDDSPRAA